MSYSRMVALGWLFFVCSPAWCAETPGPAKVADSAGISCSADVSPLGPAAAKVLATCLPAGCGAVTGTQDAVGQGAEAATARTGERPFPNVIRPKKVDAKVKGCKVSEPGKYQATQGDLIELEYTYPVVPEAMPDQVNQETDKGAIYTANLGIRRLQVPGFVGTQTYVFYFEARDKGRGIAYIVIDEVKYEYAFEVSEQTQAQ